jgi:hypothetical protein
MQTIKTETGTYKISDTRDAGEFMRQLAKPKKRAKREKDPVRNFPRFYPGDTTTAGYIRDYYRLNGFTDGVFTCASTNPSPVYDASQPIVEVSHENE